MTVPRVLRPNTDQPRRPDPQDPAQHEAVMYVRSILLMRIGVGLAGIFLRITLWLVDKLYFHGDPQPRDSMSAYYYSQRESTRRWQGLRRASPLLLTLRRWPVWRTRGRPPTPASARTRSRS